MIAASFGAASSKGTTPGVVEEGMPKSLGAGMVQAAQIIRVRAQNRLIRVRFITISAEKHYLLSRVR